MSDLFGVKMSLGTVNRLRKEASCAVSGAVEEAKAYIQAAPIVGADETGFGQGNADGQNPHQHRAWFWVAVTPLVTFFQVLLSRSTAAAQSLLGENFAGILNGYGSTDAEIAHLSRTSPRVGFSRPEISRGHSRTEDPFEFDLTDVDLSVENQPLAVGKNWPIFVEPLLRQALSKVDW